MYYCRLLLLHVLSLIVLCEKCVSQFQSDNFKFRRELSSQYNTDIQNSGELRIGLGGSKETSHETEIESFNKTVFIIPITGILLVITMVLLYIYYTCNMRREEIETIGKQIASQRNTVTASELEEEETYVEVSEFCDYPPSYLEATHENNPPSYNTSDAKIAKSTKVMTH